MAMKETKIMDLHNHTICSDACHTPEEIIVNAIKNNISTIGISDHFDTIKCRSISPAKLYSYISSINYLKEKFKDKIQILTGVEICMNRQWYDVDNLPYDDLGNLDYVLLEYVDWFNDSVRLNDIEQYAKKFTCKVGLAHTNLFDFYELYGLKNILEILQQNNIFWELNVNEGYEYFDDIISNLESRKVKSLFKRLKEKGIKITVGSDTHSLSYFNVGRLKLGNALASHDTIQ